MSSTPDSVHHNFGLTEREFIELQEKIRQGDEQLFERVFLTHFEYCMNYLKSRYKAGHAYAYDTVMWSMLRFRLKLLEGKLEYGNLQAYLLRIAIAQYQKDQGNSKEVFIEIFPEMPVSYEAEADPADEETLAQLARAWDKLGDLCRQLLQGFYYDKIDLRTLTAQLADSSEANTRKRKERCIKELRKHFFELE